MKSLTLVLVLCSLFLVVNGIPVLVGSGASMQSLLWQLVTFVYQGVNPSVLIDYTASNSGGGVTDLGKNKVDFAGVVYQNNPNGSSLLPIAGIAMAIMYNIEGLDTLVMDRETLNRVYTGDISMWNDTAISDLNPGFTFPNASITIIYLTGGANSGTTSIFIAGLVSFGAPKNLSSDPGQWAFAKQGRGIAVGESADVQHFVANIPNSIGYITHPFAQGSPTITLINKMGKKVQPNSETVDAALMSPKFGYGKVIQSNYIDGDDENAYPIVALTFIMYHTDTHLDCYFTLLMAEMFYWLATSTLAQQSEIYQNYIPVPTSLSGVPIQQLSDIKCNGAYAYDYLAPYEVVMLVVGMTMAGICLILALLVFLTRNAYEQSPTVILLNLVGKIASYFSVYLWLGYPRDWICKCRPFLAFLAFTSVAGELGIILHRVFRNHTLVKKTGRFSEYKILLMLLSGSVLIILLWYVVQAPSEIHRRCSGDKQLDFTIALIIYNVFLMASGPSISFYRKRFHGDTNINLSSYSQRSISISFVCGALFIPINLIETNDSYTFLGRLFSPASGTLIYTTLLLLTVNIPQLHPTWKSIALNVRSIASQSITKISITPPHSPHPPKYANNEIPSVFLSKGEESAETR